MTAELLPVHGLDGRALDVLAAPARNPATVYLESLRSAESRRTMHGCLTRMARMAAGLDDEQWAALSLDAREGFAASLRWGELTYAHTSHIRALVLAKGWSPAYVNKHLTALRRVLREAWRLGQMDAETYQRAADLDKVEGVRLPTGQHIPGESIAAVLATCDVDAGAEDPHRRVIGLRDAALFAAMWSTGCRRAELAALELVDYDPGSRSLRVRHGKRDKERLVYLIGDAVARLEVWLRVRGTKPGALFARVRRGGHVVVDKQGHPAPMTPRAIGTIVDARFTAAQTARRTPHDFRRTFIGELLDAGVDLATAQALAGHASPATTARYDRRPEARKREATDQLGRLPR